MSGKNLFLVGAGHLPPEKMFQGATDLLGAWGGVLTSHQCSESPRKVLEKFQDRKGLVCLHGDAAMANSKGSTWLEALGAWRHPTVLLATPMFSGEFSGAVAAYSALCKNLSVPLLGIVQLGGTWDFRARQLDGLPWCGYIPESPLKFSGPKSLFIDETFCNDDNLLELAQRLRVRLLTL